MVSKLNMGKYAKDKRKYRKEWETTNWGKGWLQHIDMAKHKSPNNPNEAHCKICETSLRSHLADLQRHAKSKKHQDRSAILDKTRYTSLVSHGYQAPVSDEKKIIDIKLALYIVMHSSIRSIDHLGDLLSTLGKGSDLEKLRLHRTKCSTVIKNVIAPTFLDDVVRAVGDKGFSIIIDESTDVSVTKHLCMCIKYFDTTENRLIIDFLGILEVERAAAVDLYTSIEHYFQHIKMSLKNLTAIGTDGASNLCGRNHSVYTMLKKDVPTLQLMKCTCHSLHLCASKASEELPSSLDFLAREFYNWFSVSPLRRITYKKTFNMINSGQDAQKFRPMIQLSRTRWLAFYDVVKRLLEQWMELKIHFRIACDAERCYTARTLHDMLDDDSNRLYLLFSKPILAEIQHLNISFQSEKVDVGSLYEEMYSVFLLFAKCILKPVFLRVEKNESLVEQVANAVSNELAFLPIAEVDFGIKFSKENDRSHISAESKLQIKQRCFNFLKKLLFEMSQRLPSNFEVFKKIKLFSPSSCISHVRVKFEDLSLQDFFDPKVDVSVYKSQWEKLSFVDWKEHYRGDIPTNIVMFWPDVYKYTDACGRFVFREFAEVVLKMLTIPTSNAAVERAFSALTLIKTRVRNKLKTSMLQALLRIRLHFQCHEECCKTFKPSSGMLERFKSSSMYPSAAGTANGVKNEGDENEADGLSEMLDIIADLA